MSQRKVAIIGLPRYYDENLYNSAAIINNQKILGYHDKVLLPTYDVFDEKDILNPQTLSSLMKLVWMEKLLKLEFKYVKIFGIKIMI